MGQNVILEVWGCFYNLCEVWMGWVFVLGLLNGFKFGLNVECGNGALSIRIGPREAWADWVK